MAKDPAFLFYPGDYLRDTQNLSENTQVAYDRIMCEHMRNICISQQQLKFFTKRLSDDERSELMFMLTEINGGYQIDWVAESITKRKAYSESRRNNRTSKPKKDKINTSLTYDKHMENVNEDVIIVKDKKVKYSEFVSMTEEEYNKLVEEHKEVNVKTFIFILDNYKGSSGKKYKSDYRAILSWVIDKAKSDNKYKSKVKLAT